MPPKKDQTEKPKELEPISGPSSPGSRRSSRNPAICHGSFSIEEISEDISSQLDQLIEEGKNFEEIFCFYLSKKTFSLEQTSKWLEKFNHFRRERRLSSFLKESLKQEPSEFARQKVAEEAVESLISSLCKKRKWSLEDYSETEGYATSSDCSSGDEEPRRSPLPRKHQVFKKLSWKEFKGANKLDKVLGEKTKNTNIKHLIKLTMKELFKQKKKAKKLAKEKEKGIEVTEDEVLDMFYDVTDHMAKRYLPRIRQLTERLDPAVDPSGSECESGSYDSEDNFYEHKEDKRSLLPKMAMSVDPELLVKNGLYKVLLLTLPLCFDYTDGTQVYEFIQILKEAKKQVIPEEMKLGSAPDPLSGSKEREEKSTEIKAEAAVEQSPSYESSASQSSDIKAKAPVQPSPSNETLAGMADIKEWRRDSMQEDIPETTEITERLSRRTLRSEESEDSQSIPFIDESTSNSGEFVFPDGCRDERRATLASPEEVSDIQMPEVPGPVPTERSESTSSERPRRGSRRRSENIHDPGMSPAKRRN